MNEEQDSDLAHEPSDVGESGNSPAESPLAESPLAENEVKQAPLHRAWIRVEDSWQGLKGMRQFLLPKAAEDIPLLPSAEHTVIVMLAAFVGLYAGLAATFLRISVHLIVLIFLRPARLLEIHDSRPFMAVWYAVRHEEIMLVGFLIVISLIAVGVYRRTHPLGLRKERNRVIIVGGLLALAAFSHVIIQMMGAFSGLLKHKDELTLDILHSTPWWGVLLVSLIGGTLVGLLSSYFKGANGEGVPDIMAGVALKGGRLDLKEGVSFAGASAVTAGALGSAGLEGPVVVIGATIASFLGEILNLRRPQLRILAAAGAAAGISASFNAPIAGALFALEIIVGDFALASFSPVVIASVLGTVVRQSIEGDAAVLGLASFQMVSSWELFLYAGLGLICGIFGTFFVKTLEEGGSKVAERLAVFPKWLRPVIGIGTLVLVAKLLGHVEVLGSGHDAMEKLLTEPLALSLVGVIIIGKIIATTVTFGAGGVGGVMFPTLLVGASIGHLYGGILKYVFGTRIADPIAYAVVGMGAFLTAVQQAPLTATVMIFEFTNDYTVVMPLLVAGIISTLLSIRALGRNIYQRTLLRQGISLSRGKDQTILAGITVAEAMDSKIKVTKSNTQLQYILEMIEEADQTTFPVVDEQEKLVGVFSVRDIHPILFENDLRFAVVAFDFMTTRVVTVTPEDTFREALSAFSFGQFDHLVVIDSISHRVIGMLSRHALLEVYRAHLERGSLDSAGVAS